MEDEYRLTPDGARALSKEYLIIKERIEEISARVFHPDKTKRLGIVEGLRRIYQPPPRPCVSSES